MRILRKHIGLGTVIISTPNHLRGEQEYGHD